MSVDQLASGSFGDSNVRPPPSSPQQKTPTTTAHPDSVFETPRQGQCRFDDAAGSGWTPRFAEEFSLFNATPGNLRASPRQGAFAGEFSCTTPFTSAFPRQKGPQPSPAPGGQQKKRTVSVEGIAEEIATHATHFSTNSNLPLPPVAPSQRLPSSPNALALTHDEAHPTSHEEGPEPQASAPAQRLLKKAKLDAANPDTQGPTPPPSSTRGRRKLAPKVEPDKMQDDQGFREFAGAGAGNQHPNMGMFATSPGDMFGFSISAPPSAHSFVDAQQFWETEAGAMAGMELDFTAAQHAAMFQSPTTAAQMMSNHRSSGSLDWGRANQMFQETGLLPQQQAEQAQHQLQQMPQQSAQRQSQETRRSPAKRTRPLAPKTLMPNLDTSAMEQSMLLDASMYQTPIEDSFSLSHGQGVDPGMLFSRPPSSSMDAVFNPMQPHQQPHRQHGSRAASSHRTLAPASGQRLPQQQSGHRSQGRSVALAPAPVKGLGISAKAPTARTELRRANTAKELSSSKRGNRTVMGSPAKPRQGLSRSFSENHGRHQVGRPSSASSTSSHHTVIALENQLHHQPPPVRSLSANSNRPPPHGRVSPFKSQHGHRLPSLTSIPEASPGAPNAAALAMKRASVKFTIDADGRARVETVVADDEPRLARRRGRSPRKALGGGSGSGSRSSSRWDSTDDERGPARYDEDDASSTDDEPIIIPSRNTSFVLDDPLKVSGQRARYHHISHRTSQRSLSETSTASSLLGGRSSSNDPEESEAETVVNGGGVLASGAGDAASELERLRQSRRQNGGRPKLSIPGSGGSRQRFGDPSGGSFAQEHHQQQYSSAATSPTTMTEVSLPTPSTATRVSRGIRCVCDNTGVDHSRDGFMVQCESCEMWLHGRCINIPKRSMMPSVYICAFCARTSHGHTGRPSIPPSAASPLAHKSFPKFR